MKMNLRIIASRTLRRKENYHQEGERNLIQKALLLQSLVQLKKGLLREVMVRC
jgi:hypothetical protein